MLRSICMLLVLALSVLFTGCSALPLDKLKGAFTNRLAITLDDGECLWASRWGPFALGSDLDGRDCQVLVQAMRLRMLMLNAGAARAAGASD